MLSYRLKEFRICMKLQHNITGIFKKMSLIVFITNAYKLKDRPIEQSQSIDQTHSLCDYRLEAPRRISERRLKKR